MKLTKHLNRLLTLILLMIVSACVTINVYFPASEAGNAAEEFVEDIINKDRVEAPKDSSLSPLTFRQQLFAWNVQLISGAHAAAPDFNIDTPEIHRIKASMQQRHEELDRFYAAGAIGFGNSGLVAWRDKNAVSLKDRGRLTQLVNAENADRNKLYKAIANANGHPEWEKQVRDIFDEKWIKKAPVGWWYQNAGGNWKQK